MTRYKKPMVGLAAIIINGDKVLFGKRKSDHGKGTWAFPGGKLEYYESFMRAIKREVYEETELYVRLIDQNPSAVTNDIFSKTNRKHYVTLFFRVKYISGNPIIKEPTKHDGWMWFSWESLPIPLFKPIQNLIKQGYNPFNAK